MNKRRAMDYTLLILTVALVCIGLILVYDASYYSASEKFGDAAHFLKSQIVGAVLGLIVMLVLAHIDYRRLKVFAVPLLIVSFVMLGLVLHPKIGTEVNGARRWLIIGVSVQPSEIAKFALVLFMAVSITNKREAMSRFTSGMLPYLLITGSMCGLVLLQPNFSMAINIAGVMMLILYIGGARGRDLTLAGIAGVAAGIAGIMDGDYRQRRMLAFLDPWADVRGTGWQLVQSLYALGSGGLFGTGFGKSRQKFNYLPYRESDFIFAIFGEEFGFIGAVVLIGLFVMLFWRGMKISMSCQDRFGSLLAAGITASLALQTIINVAVVTSSIPPTGLPLPFISYGSSSLVICMASVGILLNISRSSALAAGRTGGQKAAKR